MNKYLYILAVLSMAPMMAAAQTLESDVDAELDQMYANQKASNVQNVQATPAQAQQAQPLNLNGSQPIYILNQAPSSASAQLQTQGQQSQVQKQPTTVIEASPLTESRAEQIRRSRQDAEVQTEQRIVEKLEQSRMEDEKKRANVLFGDKFNALNNQQQQEAQPVQQVQQVQAPVQVQQVHEPKENTRDIIREELASAMKSEEAAAQAPIESKYVAAMAGVADLPDVRNVKGNYSLGVAFGNKYDNFIIEGAFIYSNYTVDQSGGLYGLNVNSTSNPFNVDVNQYTGQLAGKVQLFSGVIRPVLGALASYSYRTFALTNNYSNTNYGSDAKSYAIDFGALAGVDLEFSPKYSLGLDFRYMWNMSSRIDANSNSWVNSPSYGTPIEKLQYYVMSVVGRVNF